MSFSVLNKVALVTGATGGIGFQIVKELLEKGAKGVSLVDINPDPSEKLLEELKNEFGPNKAIFIQADVGNKEQFDEAFKKTIEKLKNLDIVVNNAGILYDIEPELTVRVNLIGSINGTYLAVEKYLEKYRSTPMAVVLNVSSVAGIEPYGSFPVYSATKFGILGLTLSWGEHFERNNIKVLAVCPGPHNTRVLENATREDCHISKFYYDLKKDLIKALPAQTPKFCAERIVKVIKKGESSTAWIIDNDEPHKFVLPCRDNMEKIYL